MNYRMMTAEVLAAGLVVTGCSASQETAPPPPPVVSTPFTESPHSFTSEAPTPATRSLGCTTIYLGLKVGDEQSIQPSTASIGDIGGYVMSKTDGLITYGIGAITEDTGHTSNINIFSQFPQTFDVTSDANKPLEVDNDRSSVTLTILPRALPHTYDEIVQDKYCFLADAPETPTPAASSPTA